MTETLRVLLLLEAVGLAALPLAARALGRLPGAGLGLAKVLGLLLLTWVVWMAGSVGIPNGLALAIGGAVALALAGLAARRVNRRRPVAREDAVFRRRALIAAEALFALSFLAGAVFFAFSPDVWGTEKPMDMMLVNATLAGDSFPPHDPWLAGEHLNYYYLGHLAAGLLIRLTGVEPTAGYNLAMAAVLALTATAAFTLAATLAEAARRAGAPVRRPLIAGGIAVVLLAVMGNLRGGWAALTHTGPLVTFEWFEPSRIIPGTINEFPWFSFLVGDLHAHVIAVPLTLLALAFVAQAALEGVRWTRLLEGFCAALAVGILYAVNSWSWPVVAGLLLLALLPRGVAVLWGLAVVAAGVVLMLPFIVAFDPNARGFGIVATDDRQSLGAFLSDLGVIYGALLWLLLAPLIARLRAGRTVRILVWGVAAAVVALSLLSELRLAGAAAIGLLLAAALQAALSRRVAPPERIVWVLIAGGLGCLLLPEVVYVRDEFAGTEFVRMNTVFKMGYQAWLLLAVAGAVVLVQGRRWLPGPVAAGWQTVAAGLIAVGLVYSVAAAGARKDGFADGPRLDGTRWLARTAPGDVAAAAWLRERTRGDAVVLEAVGDDYSPFGYARISTYTGRPTVLGWPGHELQWSHAIGSRRDDVRTLYTTDDAAVARDLIDRYRVRYVVVGPLERTTYGEPGAVAALGRPVFEGDGTTVLELPAPGPVPREERPEAPPPFLGD